MTFLMHLTWLNHGLWIMALPRTFSPAFQHTFSPTMTSCVISVDDQQRGHRNSPVTFFPPGSIQRRVVTFCCGSYPCRATFPSRINYASKTAKPISEPTSSFFFFLLFFVILCDHLCTILRALIYYRHCRLLLS